MYVGCVKTVFLVRKVLKMNGTNVDICVDNILFMHISLCFSLISTLCLCFIVRFLHDHHY